MGLKPSAGPYELASRGDSVLLVVEADSEAAIPARLAEDPWPDELLTVESIRPCPVWLRGAQAG